MFQIVMTFISLTFVALLAFGSLSLTQAEEACGAHNSDVWNDPAESSEGTCSRPTIKNDAKDIEEADEEETEVAETSFFDMIKTVINFMLMIFRWYMNMNG